MITASRISGQIKAANDKLGEFGAAIDQFGMAKAILSELTIKVLVLYPESDMIPIEIRRNPKELGWLYDKSERFVIFEDKSIALSKLLKAVEAGVKAGGKAFSETPEEYKLLKSEDGSIYTFLKTETLKKILN
jgi:hypothetical protein